VFDRIASNAEIRRELLVIHDSLRM
jgi:hypothetical protein